MMEFCGMDNNSNEFGQWSRNSEDILNNKYPLHKACRDGDIDRVCLLIMSAGQQYSLVEDEFYGWTPAHWSSYFGKLACLRRIMQFLPAEPMTSRYQQSPAHLAAYASHPHCLKWLLATGSDLNQTDYLGETPTHKAARTGSMECVALLAAHHADLNVQSNCGMAASELAAKCGYADCALYLQRAAEQQQLKRSGIIHDVVLPVVPNQSVLPGQIPDKCVIIQGLNGGRLPSSIDSQHTPKANNSMDVELEQVPNRVQNGDVNGHGDQQHNGMINGFGNHTNGMPNGLVYQNGISHSVEEHQIHFGENFGEHRGYKVGLTGISQPNGLQKDVLLSQDVSNNIVPVAGRKRGREEIEDDENEEWKRVRRLEMGDCQDDLAAIQQPCFVRQLAENSSVEEHRSYMVAQQGYDSLMYETMLLEFHGA